MAVTNMKLINIIGLMQNLDEVAEICGESGIFQPDNVFSFYSNTQGFVQISEESPYAKPVNEIAGIVNAMGKSLKIVDISDFDINREQIREYVDYLSEKFGGLLKERDSLEQARQNCLEEITKIKCFQGVDFKIKDLLDCEYVKIRFGKLPKEEYAKLSSYSENENILFFPFTNDENYYWGVYFAKLENIDEVDRIFSGLYFERVELEPFDGTVNEELNSLNAKLALIEKDMDTLNKKFETYWNSQKGQCTRVYSKLYQLNVYYNIKKFAASYKDSFILLGWIPAENEREFCRKLSKVSTVEYSLESGKNVLNHLPPVKLKNKRIFRPFEFFVDTYGLPSYDEIDPTVFVSLTYTILFGIMFADLGQGLVVSIVGYLMWKLKKMKLGRALISCGISSSIFGTLFGSVFGYEHVLDGFYKNVFGLKGKPIEVMESEGSNLIIYGAVGIGVVLLILAMIINIYSSVKRRRYGDALFSPNGLCGLVLYVSAIVLLLDNVVLHLGIFNVLLVGLLIVVPLLCIMFKEILDKLVEHKRNWMPESWGDYISQNIFELFEVVLSYVTGTMSFLRVGAFVLVHAGMMLVVFTIAEMLGGVGYVIAVVLGNIIVIGLEALLAGIQVLRLEFYEMFSRFFEGQGRPFSPIIANKTIKESA